MLIALDFILEMIGNPYRIVREVEGSESIGRKTAVVHYLQSQKEV